MNPEIKAKWLDALRSGEYKQGRATLRQGTGEFCCLGVLCDLYPDANWKLEIANEEVGNYFSFDGASSILPTSVRVWAGLTRGSPRITNNDGISDALTELNDSGTSFAEIADLIEKSL